MKVAFFNNTWITRQNARRIIMLFHIDSKDICMGGNQRGCLGNVHRCANCLDTGPIEIEMSTIVPSGPCVLYEKDMEVMQHRRNLSL